MSLLLHLFHLYQSSAVQNLQYDCVRFVPRVTYLEYMSMYHFAMADMIYNQAITLKLPDGLFHQHTQTLQALLSYIRLVSSFFSLAFASPGYYKF